MQGKALPAPADPPGPPIHIYAIRARKQQAGAPTRGTPAKNMRGCKLAWRKSLTVEAM